VIVFAILVAAFPIYRGVFATRRVHALTAQTRAQIAGGHHLWALNCSSCHGANGQGIDAPALNSQQFLGSITDEQMHRLVSAGITGTAMPAWLNDFGGPLTDEEIAALVAYVRSWQKTAPSRPDWRSPAATATPGSG